MGNLSSIKLRVDYVTMVWLLLLSCYIGIAMSTLRGTTLLNSIPNNVIKSIDDESLSLNSLVKISKVTTKSPTLKPSKSPAPSKPIKPSTRIPTRKPSKKGVSTKSPTLKPTSKSTKIPTILQTELPTEVDYYYYYVPTILQTELPILPTKLPTKSPTEMPTVDDVSNIG